MHQSRMLESRPKAIPFNKNEVTGPFPTPKEGHPAGGAEPILIVEGEKPPCATCSGKGRVVYEEPQRKIQSVMACPECNKLG